MHFILKIYFEFLVNFLKKCVLKELKQKKNVSDVFITQPLCVKNSLMNYSHRF